MRLGTVATRRVSAGIGVGLRLVQRLAGGALAERTARQMDVEWTENPR
jgi:transcriptional regulator GlxA family with amidase domain